MRLHPLDVVRAVGGVDPEPPAGLQDPPALAGASPRASGRRRARRGRSPRRRRRSRPRPARGRRRRPRASARSRSRACARAFSAIAIASGAASTPTTSRACAREEERHVAPRGAELDDEVRRARGDDPEDVPVALGVLARRVPEPVVRVKAFPVRLVVEVPLERHAPSVARRTESARRGARRHEGRGRDRCLQSAVHDGSPRDGDRRRLRRRRVRVARSRAGGTASGCSRCGPRGRPTPTRPTGSPRWSARTPSGRTTRGTPSAS